MKRVLIVLLAVLLLAGLGCDTVPTKLQPVVEKRIAMNQAVLDHGDCDECKAALEDNNTMFWLLLAGYDAELIDQIMGGE